jgi:hypothetical protein
VIVRISKGRFDLERLAQVEQLLVDSEHALREPLQALPGLIHYYAGIDREKGYATNVSVWDSLEHAHQMDTFQPMLAQRPIVEGVGVRFEVLTNHDAVWTITP